MKLETSNRKIAGKFQNMWTLNNTLLNNVLNIQHNIQNKG